MLNGFNEFEIQRDFRKKSSNDINDLHNSIVLYYLRQNMKNENTSLKTFMTSIEKKIIYSILEITEGNQKSASKLLGIGATTLNEKIKKYGMVYTRLKTNIKLNIERKINLLK